MLEGLVSLGLSQNPIERGSVFWPGKGGKECLSQQYPVMETRNAEGSLNCGHLDYFRVDSLTEGEIRAMQRSF